MIVCEPLALNEVKLLRPKLYHDDRGYVTEIAHDRQLAEVGINVGFVQENQTYSKGSILASSRLRLTETGSASFQVSAGDGNRTEFISVNSPGTVIRGEKLLVTGMTNLPNDTELLYTVVQQSNISVFTIDPRTGTQATQAGLTRSGIIDVLPGTGGSNTWSFALDTTEFIPDRYEVIVATIKENQTAKSFDIGNVSGSSFLIVQDVPAGTGVS